MRAISMITTVALAIASAVFHTTEAKDQTIEWVFGTFRGSTKFDVLQCQSFTFDWSGDSSDGGPHNVFEFQDEAAYDACNFTGARELAPSSVSGNFALSGEDTLQVTKRWFGCNVPSHCSAGNMKVALKVRPLLEEKYPGFDCSGGKVAIVKKEPTLKACRKRCKRRRGCFAIQYKTVSSECSVYNVVPGQGDANSDSTCEIAATSCQKEETGIEPSKTQVELNAARALWNAQGIVDYEYQTRLSCFCVEEYRKAMNALVLGGSTMRAAYVDKGKPVPEKIAVPSIDDQFNTIQKAIDNKAHMINVEYDAAYGFPLQIYIDYNEMIADEELSRSNSKLVPLTNPEQCNSNVCLTSEFCCNESCSICSPIGGFCIQLVC